MAGSSALLSAATLLLLVFIHSSSAATPTASAPAPAASGPINVTDILAKNGDFATFIRLLRSTQADTQITNQLNSSTEGMTVFAPTDNAFSNLKAGTLNSLTAQQQVQLIQYHILPKFYTWDTFETASNPLNTQASGRTGNWGFNVTTLGVQQVNISTGVVTTQVNNELRLKFPLAVYQVEKVLLPDELFGAKANAPVSSPDVSTPSSAKVNSTAASGPSSTKSTNDAAGTNALAFTFLAALFIGLLF